MVLGETTFEVSPVTTPTVLSIDTEEAPETDQERVAEEPVVMEAGETEKEDIVGVAAGGGGGVVPVWVREKVSLPVPAAIKLRSP